MSPDLKLATAYVMPLGGKDEKPVLDALERNRKALRTEVAHRLSNMKYAPDLRFRRDETFDDLCQDRRAAEHREGAAGYGEAAPEDEA